MKVHVLTVSHKQPAWVHDACAEYEKRLPREWAFRVVEVKPEPRTSGVTAERVQAAEAVRLQAAVPKGARVVALDERGDAWPTRTFAERLDRWQHDGRAVVFVIGGADGLDEEIKKRAAALVRLSSLTLPHALAQVVLVEQIYRAATLLTGHPYHRA
jgi:23S rRNA (pseudouridine1915-N3)-methyltransferase